MARILLVILLFVGMVVPALSQVMTPTPFPLRAAESSDDMCLLVPIRYIEVEEGYGSSSAVRGFDGDTGRNAGLLSHVVTDEDDETSESFDGPFASTPVFSVNGDESRFADGYSVITRTAFDRFSGALFVFEGWNQFDVYTKQSVNTVAKLYRVDLSGRHPSIVVERELCDTDGLVCPSNLFSVVDGGEVTGIDLYFGGDELVVRVDGQFGNTTSGVRFFWLEATTLAFLRDSAAVLPPFDALDPDPLIVYDTMTNHFFESVSTYKVVARNAESFVTHDCITTVDFGISGISGMDVDVTRGELVVFLSGAEGDFITTYRLQDLINGNTNHFSPSSAAAMYRINATTAGDGEPLDVDPLATADERRFLVGPDGRYYLVTYSYAAGGSDESGDPEMEFFMLRTDPAGATGSGDSYSSLAFWVVNDVGISDVIPYAEGAAVEGPAVFHTDTGVFRGAYFASEQCGSYSRGWQGGSIRIGTVMLIIAIILSVAAVAELIVYCYVKRRRLRKAEAAADSARHGLTGGELQPVAEEQFGDVLAM